MEVWKLERRYYESMKGNDDHGFGPRLGVVPLWT